MKQLKKTILTLVALLAVTTGAWAADVLNIVVSGTSATIMYDGNSSNNPILSEKGWQQNGNTWDMDYTNRSTITTVTIDGSCKNFSGTKLKSLFNNFSVLTTINGLENLNTATVQNMDYMFANCSSLTSLDLSSLNTASVTTMIYMFGNCSKLTSLDLSSWNTENVETTNSLFLNCSELTTVDLSGWNTAKLWNTYYMFCDCSKLENIYVGDGWSTAAVTSSDDMFTGCSKLLSMNTANPATDKTNAHTGDGGYLKVKPAAASGPEVAWDKATKTGTFTMPGGNVTLEPEYYPQAALTAVPTAINDVPATTDGAIVKAGTVANIGSTETAQGTVMYYVSQTALDDAALLALAADQWTADVPTAEKLTKGEAYVYYYVRGNDSDTDEENFSDGDILSANALTVTIAAEPTKVTLAANDKTMGTVEVAGESKVEWTADTWKGWTADIKEHTVDDITITGTQKTSIYELTSEDKYKNSLLFFVVKVWDNSTVTFSTTGDPFSRIEFTMIDDYSQYNPNIIPNDNWTVEGKSAVWEGEATKSLTLQSCSTQVSKITFFKGATPDGVTINGDGTFTVAKTATVTLKATPAEGYKFLYWEDDQTNTNPVREVTIESGMADMTYKAVFAEILYNVTFAEGTDPNEWTADPDADVKKGQTVTVTYTGSKKVIGVKAEKKAAEEPVTLATPLTVEAITAGTIMVNTNGTLSTGMKYSVNGGTKTPITSTTTIEGLKAGDKVQFYSNGTSNTAYSNDPEVKISGGTAEVKVYGNIMSLLDEEGFATKTDLPNYAFFGLFMKNTTLIDASELLLPAATVAVSCYQQMFEGCTSLTKAPKLPATTLESYCYYSMFQFCTSLTTAPELPAEWLDMMCYAQMFSGCTSLTSAYVKAAYKNESEEYYNMFYGCTATGAVLHTTSGNKASWEGMMGTGKTWPNWTVAGDWQE